MRLAKTVRRAVESMPRVNQIGISALPRLAPSTSDKPAVTGIMPTWTKITQIKNATTKLCVKNASAPPTRNAVMQCHAK